MARKQSGEEIRRRQLLDAFWMPSVQTMVSRKSSITNAFVNTILPIVQPSVEEIEQALQILSMAPADLRCSYCGNKATEWDHLRPIVDNMRPTGYISEIANLVPACAKCNQSKRNAHWKAWMLSNTRHSPTGREISNINELVARLDSYEQWKTPTKLDFEKILGPEAWAKYWSMWESVIAELKDCQAFADSLRESISAGLKAQ